MAIKRKLLFVTIRCPLCGEKHTLFKKQYDLLLEAQKENRKQGHLDEFWFYKSIHNMRDDVLIFS